MNVDRQQRGGFFAKLFNIARGILAQGCLKRSGDSADTDIEEITEPCCGPAVHIAYRGKVDDRLYVAYNRSWQEVRFFQPEGLRVFCATCRRRVL